MPTTREFKKTKSGAKKTHASDISDNAQAKAKTVLSEETPEVIEVNAEPATEPTTKRRPGRETSQQASPPPEVEMQTETTPHNAEELAAEFEAEKSGPKVEINFKGSELLRARFPKPFQVAEAVASDWISEGKFDHLPIEHPLTNWAAQQSLLKAKELEKKVVESPAVEKAAMAALTMAMKAQGVFEQMRSRMKRS